ncbi:hypothetical protein [Paracoccus methylarcula]|nr:hypothetical protein [Paracoccus methylarcula]
MMISAEMRRKPGHDRAGSRNAYVLYAPLELEQRVLDDAGRQIEAVAYAVADRIPAIRAGELMELAARIQKFRIQS